MPEPQVLHLVASTVTPSGLSQMAACSQIQPFTECILDILNSPLSLMQGPLTPLQGQFFSQVMPFSITYCKALKLKPPQQPLFPQSSEQSTSCCQDRQTVFCFDRAQDSSMATALKAQQEAQFPWFFTGDTLPCETQSMFKLVFCVILLVSDDLSASNIQFEIGLRQISANSASLIAEN